MTSTNKMWKQLDKQQTKLNNFQKQSIHKQSSDNLEINCDSLLKELNKTDIKSTSNTELTQQNSCSIQAREPDVTVDELGNFKYYFLNKKY